MTLPGIEVLRAPERLGIEVEVVHARAAGSHRALGHPVSTARDTDSGDAEWRAEDCPDGVSGAEGAVSGGGRGGGGPNATAGRVHRDGAEIRWTARGPVLAPADAVRIRFYIDPETGYPHATRYGVEEQEIEEVLARPGEDRAGREGARVAIGKAALSSSYLTLLAYRRRRRRGK